MTATMPSTEVAAGVTAWLSQFGDALAAGDPAEAGGVVESWIDFETAAGRGRGHLRLRGGQCWTLLTSLYELKGHEERHGPSGTRSSTTGSRRPASTMTGATTAPACS
jgi:putative flavoprotein involved in K+ transport